MLNIWQINIPVKVFRFNIIQDHSIQIIKIDKYNDKYITLIKITPSQYLNPYISHNINILNKYITDIFNSNNFNSNNFNSDNLELNNINTIININDIDISIIFNHNKDVADLNKINTSIK